MVFYVYLAISLLLIAYHYSFVCRCRYQSMVYYQYSFLFGIDSHRSKCHMLPSKYQRIPMLTKILQLRFKISYFK